MRDFCKLYHTEEYGQILVTIDTDDDANPSVKTAFVPKGLGVCSIGPSYKDTDEGWDKAEKWFNDMTQETAVGMVEAVVRQLEGMTGEEEV